MFDSVFVNCPACGKQLEFQSKAGPCELKRYHVNSVPPIIAYDVDGDVKSCECGQDVTLVFPSHVDRVSMAAQVKTLEGWD